jgi:phage shock protein A
MNDLTPMAAAAVAQLQTDHDKLQQQFTDLQAEHTALQTEHAALVQDYNDIYDRLGRALQLAHTTAYGEVHLGTLMALFNALPLRRDVVTVVADPVIAAA